MPKVTITEEEKQYIQGLVRRARAAMFAIKDYDQAQVDKLCQAIGWATANEKTFMRLTLMGFEETQIGDPEGGPIRRFRIMGMLRDALRAKSVGIIEEIPEKGIVKYGKPAGVIAGILPVTNPFVTMVFLAINAIKCKDAVVYSPHPKSKKTAMEVARVMSAALKKLGAPEDLLLCIENPTIPQYEELMANCDLTIATGGQNMVRRAYSSGKPAYSSGAGNATIIIDETAAQNIEEAAMNTRISKTNNNGSGCSCDGNCIVEASVYDRFLEQLIKEGGYLVNEEEKKKLQAVMWDDKGHRTMETVARAAVKMAQIAGFTIPEDRKFIIVKEDKIGKEYPFCSEKVTTVLAIFKYSGGFENALKMVEQILEVGGKGHSTGIYSFDEAHIHQLAMMAPVSRMMIRQPQIRGNGGNFNNGMPFTASISCGTWGGSTASENITTKHFMNTTWVSRVIPEDRPTEAEMFGEFLNTETF
jgi:sulfoacetaldehyde dehydrogenase